jgi:3'-5' exoribonuclease
LDEDLLLTGCIVHDIGKLTELTYPIGIGYALEGTLIGHISIGLIVVTAAMNTLSFPTDLALKVQHLVISHHGKLEWGSSKVPIMREAVVLHHIDMIDSSLNIFKRAEKQGIDADGLTPWVKVMDGPLYIGAPAPVTAE